MKRFPQPWSEASPAAIFWQHLREATRSVLMLDYDGTLAPFREDRFAAHPYDGVDERLAMLSLLPSVRLVLVSGRTAHEIPQLLRSHAKIEIWGNHGWEWLKRDGSHQLLPLKHRDRQALEQVMRGIAQLGFPRAVDAKPASLAIHWRGLDTALQERIRAAAESLYTEFATGSNLRLLPFDGGVELRSLERNKGSVVQDILAQEPPGLPVAYLGDDLTDEDAFEALGDRGLSILVRPTPRESFARYWIKPPEELLRFLDDWIAAASRQSLRQEPAASTSAPQVSRPGDAR